MKRTNDLYELIGSLSSSERGYCKKYIVQGSRKSVDDYLCIFEAMEKMQEYDYKLLLKLVGKSFDAKKISNLQQYLYRLLIKALKAYNEKTSPHLEIIHLFMEVEILYQHLLYDQCIDICKKLRIYIEEYELLYFAPLLVSWERKVSTLRIDEPGILPKMEENHAMDFLYAEQLKNAAYSNLLSFKVFYHGVTGGIRSPEIAAETDQIMQDEIFQNADKISSKLILHNQLQAKFAYYFFRNDFENAYIYTTKLVKLFEDNSSFSKSNCSNYIHALSNHAIVAANLQKKDVFIDSLKEIRKIDTPILQLKLQQFLSTYSLEMQEYLHQHQIEEAGELLKEYLIKQEEYKKAIPENHINIVYFHAAHYYILINDYKNALKYLNFIVNEKMVVHFRLVHSVAHILRLLIFYVTGKEEIMPAESEAAKKMIKANREFFAFEVFFLEWAMHIGTSSLSKKATFRWLKEQIVIILATPEEKVFQTYFDFPGFLEKQGI